jgi:Tfp pilus assembly protein PilO
MILAWLLLLTGLTISAVAIYYSVVGLTAIFSAAAIPIIIMGSALEVGKLVCASWLKANWERAPRFMKYYMVIAVVVLMLITSMGIFGFLSKAHNDQTLVSGDVGSKIAIYDEKIKTAKDNIEANRKQLKQMDEAVDQIMGRSSDEKGADKANAVRKSQQRDRQALAKDIEANQKIVAQLNDEAAPIRAEIRKVEAEVGPIKYIAAFIYGAAPDESMLERAVTWIIILIVVVFDPLAVIMLLAAQMTFGWGKKQEEPDWIDDQAEELTEAFNQSSGADEILAKGVTNSNPENNVKLTTEFEGVREPGGEWIQTGPEFQVPVSKESSKTPATALGGDITAPEELTADSTENVSELDKWNKMIEEAEREVAKSRESTVEERLATGQTYIDSSGNETTVEPTFPEPDLATESAGTEFPLTPVMGELFVRTDYEPPKQFKFDGAQWIGTDDSDESKKKTYMIKDETGQIQIKSR